MDVGSCDYLVLHLGQRPLTHWLMSWYSCQETHINAEHSHSNLFTIAIIDIIILINLNYTCSVVRVDKNNPSVVFGVSLDGLSLSWLLWQANETWRRGLHSALVPLHQNPPLRHNSSEHVRRKTALILFERLQPRLRLHEPDTPTPH